MNGTTSSARLLEKTLVWELERCLLKWPSLASTLERHLRDRFGVTVSPFVRDVEGLKDLMREKDIVILGSLVLQFLDPLFVRSWPSGPGDMDLYTPLRAHQEVVNYMVLKEGYTVKMQHIADNTPAELIHLLPTNSEDNPRVRHGYLDNWKNIAIISTLEKGRKSIDVVGSRSRSPLQPILSFHSTLVMNAISPDLVFTAYPELTYRRAAIWSPSHSTPIGIMRKWKERVYEIVENTSQWDPSHMCRSSAICMHTVCLTTDNDVFQVVIRRIPNEDVSKRELGDGVEAWWR